MRFVRHVAAVSLLASGCFSEPSSSSSGGDGSTGNNTTSGAGTSSGNAETSADASTGPTGSTGFGSGPGSSSSGTTGEPMACDDDTRCLPEFPGWDGPFEIVSSQDPDLPCPNMAPPQWRSNADVNDVICDCTCGSVEALCSFDVRVSSASCNVNPLKEVSLDDGECTTVNATGDFAAGLEFSNGVIAEPTCANPPPPEPTFAASVAACPVQVAGACDDGLCVSNMVGPMSRMCIARAGTEAPECPEPYSDRRVVADSVSAEAMNCNECGCAAAEASCFGFVTGFSDGACMSPSSMPEPVDAGECASLNPLLVSDLAALRYDAMVVGSCLAASATALAEGEPTLDGVRTLCCI
jgi:hypothetical protein